MCGNILKTCALFVSVFVLVFGEHDDNAYLFGRNILTGVFKNNAVVSKNITKEGEENYRCKDMLTCLQLQILRNLSDISSSDEVNLTKSLILERVTGVQVMDKPELTVEVVERNLSNEVDNELGFLSSVLVQRALGVLKTHTLRWNVIPGLDVRMFRNEIGVLDIALEEAEPDGRTFGIGPRKRILMALLPMMYKMGVMTTLLGVLIVLALKGLGISVLLLVLGVSNFVAKLKGGHGGWHSGPGHHSPPVHVHIHTDSHKQAYSGWHSGSESPYPVEYHHER